MGNKVTILLPHGEIDSEVARLARRPASLAGKRVGLIDNETWRSMHVLSDELAKVLTSEYGAQRIDTIHVNPTSGADPKEYQAQLQGFSRRVDVAISGLGN